MTHSPKILPRHSHPAHPDRERLVLFVSFPDMGLLDLTGAQTVFWAASKYMEMKGLPGYRRHTVSVNGGLVHAAEGVAVDSESLREFDGMPIDTIVVPGSPHIEKVLDESVGLVKWLQQGAARSQRIASVCSGAFLLAQAGFLNGKRATTHWIMFDLMKQRFPQVEIDRDAIFVQQERVWTSAGVTAGIDLALALVEADCGRDITMKVARELVVFLKRPGGQSQFSELLQSQSEDHAMFDDLNVWIADNLKSPGLTVERLAEKVCMSPRNFARVYKEKTGKTPAKAVEIFRLEAARRMLEESALNIDQIARHCGFGDEERMRITFQRNLAVSPSEYRKRFA